MTSHAPFRAVIAGGGPAGIEAVLALRELAPGFEVTLLAPEAEYRYRPLSTVAPFARGGVRAYPLQELADLGAVVRHDAVMRVDPDARVVTTETGEDVAYDALLVAAGAQQKRIVPRVMTFEGPGYVDAMHGLVQDIEGGYTDSVAFVAPPGVSWTLPIYELALQTADRAAATRPDVRLTVVSHEARPLEVFGVPACELAERLLQDANVRFLSGTDRPVTDRTVALPVPAGRRLAGLPADDDGFLPVDAHGRVRGAEHVWAAGDGTDHAVKQGGLATQQAEVAVRSIAAAAGLAVESPAYQPDLRGMLVTGREVWYLRRPAGADAVSEISRTPLWEPPTKIAGRRLGPFLDAIDTVTPRTNRFERRAAELPPVPGATR